MPDKQAMTVLGPVPTGELGVTLPHEHLLYDQRQYVLWPPPEEQSDGAIEMRHLGALRRSPGMIIDNAHVDDAGLAAREANAFKDAGGGTIVDVSTNGLGRNAAGLKSVAEATWLNLEYALRTRPCAYSAMMMQGTRMAKSHMENIISSPLYESESVRS